MRMRHGAGKTRADGSVARGAGTPGQGSRERPCQEQIKPLAVAGSMRQRAAGRRGEARALRRAGRRGARPSEHMQGAMQARRCGDAPPRVGRWVGCADFGHARLQACTFNGVRELLDAPSQQSCGPSIDGARQYSTLKPRSARPPRGASSVPQPTPGAPSTARPGHVAGWPPTARARAPPGRPRGLANSDARRRPHGARAGGGAHTHPPLPAPPSGRHVPPLPSPPRAGRPARGAAAASCHRRQCP